jgi:hypothetical protein
LPRNLDKWRRRNFDVRPPAVKDYFSRLKKPFWSRLPGSPEELQVEATYSGVGIKIGVPKKVIRRFTKDLRFNYAAWLWISPRDEALSSAELGAHRKPAVWSTTRCEASYRISEITAKHWLKPIPR